jgi:pimeloyl-ACP methyl ester carboxylesterase
MHYRAFPAGPDGADTPVLLLHGLGGSTFSFRDTIPALVQAGYPVLAVDLPAFGFSTRSRDIHHADGNRARWVWDLADSAFEEKEWFLVGHSMGGRVAATMAFLRPKAVAGMVQLDGALLSDRQSSWFLAIPPVRWIAAWWLRSFRFTYGGTQDLLSSAYGEPAPKHAVRGYLAPFLLPGTARALLRFARTAEPLPALELSALSVPTLLVWGEDDEWVPLEQGREVLRRMPRATLTVVPDAGHCPMETHPDAVNRRLVAFFDGRRRQQALIR